MTLGGLAIAVGLLVDAAIIMVENILHRLSGATTRRERRERALAAAAEVARPIAFATLIVIVVFLPLFGMTGIEGRMYQPLAAAVIAAMAAALILALTLVPIAAALVLKPSRSGTDEDVALLRTIKQWYAPAAGPVSAASSDSSRSQRLLVAIPAIALGIAHRQRLHAAAGRRGVSVADGASGGSGARRSRSVESPGRRRAADSPRGRGRRAPDRPRGAD